MKISITHTTIRDTIHGYRLLNKIFMDGYQYYYTHNTGEYCEQPTGVDDIIEIIKRKCIY